MAAKEKIRIRLKSYDHTLIDQASEKIVDTAKRNGLLRRLSKLSWASNFLQASRLK